jgi:2-C-methyl-D-erythritol 2,4-cyclodiphosphate synthase
VSPSRTIAASPVTPIGAYFPSNDKQWKGADSVVFIREALKKVAKAGYTVSNVDCTLILSTPKIGPHARKIQARVAELLKIAPTSVGIKAKTPEGMGTDNAAIAHVAVLLVKRGATAGQRLETAEAIPQPEVDEVVEQMLQSAEPAKKKAPKVHARR